MSASRWDPGVHTSAGRIRTRHSTPTALVGFAILILAVCLGPQVPATHAAAPVTVSVDANPGVAGTQATRSLVAEPTFTVDIFVSDVTDLQALNFEVVYDQSLVSAPTISTGPDVDRNPNAQQSLLTSTGRSWACSPPVPSGDVDPSSTVGAARLSCFSTGVPAGPTVGATPVALATLSFDAVSEGTSALTLRNVNTFQALGVESGSCSPVVVKSATCTNASVTVPVDIDGDGVKNATETACGGDKSNPARRPERIDGAFAGNDDDGDTQIDEILPPGSESTDCDGDGFIGSREQFIFSVATTVDDQAPCAATAAIGDELFDRWPPDMNDDRRANLTDIVMFGASFNKISPDPLYNPRFDLNASGGVNLSDIVLYGPHFNKSCAAL